MDGSGSEEGIRLDARDLTIFTIGHSTRALPEFLALLGENRIEFLADVRHFPRSQRAPWARKDSLAASLVAARIRYEHFEDLGGFRKPIKDSPNRAWRNPGFRGYSDHMDSPEFRRALDRLLETAAERRTGIMCAEAVPWKCHRFLLSDALLARCVRVMHILGRGTMQEHRLSKFARIHAGRVTYPASGKHV